MRPIRRKIMPGKNCENKMPSNIGFSGIEIVNICAPCYISALFISQDSQITQFGKNCVFWSIPVKGLTLGSQTGLASVVWSWGMLYAGWTDSVLGFLCYSMYTDYSLSRWADEMSWWAGNWLNNKIDNIYRSTLYMLHFCIRLMCSLFVCFQGITWLH